MLDQFPLLERDKRRICNSIAMPRVHQILALAVVMALISVLRVTTIDRSVQVHEGLGYVSRNVSTSTALSASPPPLPLWTGKLRSSENFTGYRYIQELKVNAPFKVSWSVNKRHMYKSWILLPLAANNSQQPTSNSVVHANFSFSIIRDPLERLYSGYYNKCIKSPDHENSCVGWPPEVRQANPPTLKQFLQRNFRTGFRLLHKDLHYQPITTMFPNLDRMDHVFHMGNAHFNRDIAHLWKRLGANHTLVEQFFPAVPEKRKRLEYESRVTLDTIPQHFADCETLHLGLEACKEDYHGKFASQYFPTPQWVLDKLIECGGKASHPEPP